VSAERGECLTIHVADGVAWITIQHPPINLLDTPLIRALGGAAARLEADAAVRTIVIQSADPEFFVAHGDVNSILGSVGQEGGGHSDSSPFQHMLDRFRLMPKVTIGKIDGIARGGGLELLAALDMRFCSLENTRLGQPEVPLGIIPGGGGTARWPRLIGYARALELLVGGLDIGGSVAERYGMVNRTLPAEELDDFVDTLARRIAAYPQHAVALTKQVAQHEGTLLDSLDAEAKAYSQAAASPAALEAMQRFMAAGGQTRAAECGDPFAVLGRPV
jgi:enoyl-CoA hydratase/carnithine racemase